MMINVSFTCEEEEFTKQLSYYQLQNLNLEKKWVEGDMNFTNYYCLQSLKSSLSFHKL